MVFSRCSCLLNSNVTITHVLTTERKTSISVVIHVQKTCTVSEPYFGSKLSAAALQQKQVFEIFYASTDSF